MYGSSTELPTVEEAIKFLERYQEKAGTAEIRRYEIRIRYNNADSVEAGFGDRADAVAFLRTYLPVPVREIQKNL